MLTEKKIIIFDLDGVLINSIRNMEISWAETSVRFKISKSFLNYKKFLGLPFEIILKNLKIKKNHYKIKKCYNDFSNKLFNKINIYPNVIQTLKILQKKNYILAIITSKDSIRTKKILKKFNLKFKYVFCPNKKIRPKPYPDQILKILKKEKVKKKNCFYVGDMKIDEKFAKKAKVKFIHANYGYGERLSSKLKINRIQDLIKII